MKQVREILMLCILISTIGCGGIVENTRPMLVNRYERMKTENTTMFAVVEGDYHRAKSHAERVMRQEGYGIHLHDLPEYKMFVYGKNDEFIEPQYLAAKDSIRVVLRFYELHKPSLSTF